MQIDRATFRVMPNSDHGEPPRAPVVPEPMVCGWVEYASWVSDDILLIVGWFHDDESAHREIALARNDRVLPLEARWISYSRPDISGGDGRAGKVLTARLRSPADGQGSLGSLIMPAGAATFALGPLDLAQAVTDLPTLIHGALARLDPHMRAQLVEFLAATARAHRGTTSHLRLSRSLLTIREALRVRLPACVIAPDQPQGLRIDALLAAGEQSFYIKGWVRDVESPIAQLTAVSPEGSRVELLERVFRHPRRDVEQFYGTTFRPQTPKAGFMSYFELPTPSCLATGWTLELRNASGMALETAAPSVIHDPVVARNMILADLAHERPPHQELIQNHIFPAISRLQSQLQELVQVESVTQYGTPKPGPNVSMIVPLYERIDLVEQQLAQFVHDPDIHQADLIYVLDSPELADSLADAAGQLFELYRVPFRVVRLTHNAGYSLANNIGASLARGRLLVLLNSDVLPDRPGWLATMMAFYDATPRIGALGPKLLYEDDSLQHAGLYFFQHAGVWENRHYFKGLHRSLPVANLTRPVPAVTGACLMIDRALFRQVGGLRCSYAQGDYEDSDLCLRLIEAGYENWYLPQAELYHLEGQSYPGVLRQLTYQYNAWLHTWLWNARIEAVMAGYGPPMLGSDADPVDGNWQQA